MELEALELALLGQSAGLPSLHAAAGSCLLTLMILRTGWRSAETSVALGFVVIAIFDTGLEVDNVGLAKTTDGKQKIIGTKDYINYRLTGRIHTDFQRGFIKAEVIQWDELLELGSWVKGKEAGKIRMEGKDYVVQDGDVMHYLFNV